MSAHSDLTPDPRRESWEDLRLVLAVARGGGLSGAARSLGVHHATVLRRLNALEKALGVELFVRSGRGYRPTPEGEEMATAAADIEVQVTGAYRKAAGRDPRLSGTLRLATTEYLAATALPPVLREFRDAYPEIELEITISARLASLTRRDADVACRATNDPSENLIGRRICGLAFGLYGTPEIARQHGAEGDGRPWIGVDDSIAHSTPRRWGQEYYPASRPAVRYDSLLCIFAACRAGMGAALLPRYMARTAPELIDLDPKGPAMELGLWLLTHPDLHRTPRVRAFMAFTAPRIRRWLRQAERAAAD